MTNILVVSVNWLGDVIFSTPVFKALKEAYPGVRITVLAVPRVRDVLVLCPYIDEIVIYDEEGSQRSLVAKCVLVRRLARHHFEAAFLLRPSFSRALLCWLSGIPVRVGFAAHKHSGCLTHVVDAGYFDTYHRADLYLALLEGFGIAVKDRMCRLSVSDQHFIAADDFLKRLGIKAGVAFCILNTGGNWDLKQWSEQRFITLAANIRETKGWTILLSGADKDKARCERIKMAVGSDVISIAGNTSLIVLAGVFKRALCVISADSGPLHLAAALNVSTVALFGPTRPEITGPRGPGKSVVLFRDVGCNQAPCYYLECPDNRCMKAIEVSDVIQALETI